MSSCSVIVTGGFGVLGAAVSRAFVERGDMVARIDLAQAAPIALPGAFDIGGVDLTRSDAADWAVMAATRQCGRPSVLINIAGGFTMQTLVQGGDAWLRMYAMNATTCLNMTRAAVPALLAGPHARVINLGAAGALIAGAGMGAYAAAKSAVHKLTESLAAEMSGEDITVNAVLPSIIDTPANRANMPDADFSTWVSPSAIAEVILFLASPAARAINGALIPVARGG